MRRIGLIALLALSGATTGALAQTGERCALVGQMAGSVWLEMIQALGDAQADAVESAIGRLDHLTATYARIGCDQRALNATFDCVLDGGAPAGPRAVLRQCMARHGIAQE
ncbi:hypothetical protein OB2597_13783 [Pseudooceanicola batsensis HTCC2597]|uniref:Uncharacterized protein n=1 Tax=Pseudooceanicola batsensis (strain ATCC BAA-863 / DSM 15984 / KCTC 12145 / HTCC2597) TaxID=252305 RepID=A3TYI5_PSEBH|nr:hypothetical protein [Pseudooceanicola batsensis]EAQ03219.1 hypothetical protein OB2597_13783 [Pseudooceanicola batsensis HTCC2597]